MLITDEVRVLNMIGVILKHKDLPTFSKDNMVLNSLQNKGYVEYIEQGDNSFWDLTQKGISYLKLHF